MKLRHIVLLLLIAACANETPAPPPGPPKKPIIIPPPSDADERGSIVNIARGTVVISRTGEAALETSALAAIDGDPLTAWLNPPADLPQSIVIGFPAKTRIDRIGVRSPRGNYLLKDMTFESSADGKTFAPLSHVTFDPKNEVEWRDVTPVDAIALRATIEHGVGNDVKVQSILARGRELEPAREPRVDGCWQIDDLRAASFSRDGARVTGTIGYPNAPLQLDGGSDGRAVYAEWVRGPQFGYAVVTADAEHLSGFEWHEEPITLFAAEPWFGVRATCGKSAAADDSVALAFLQRTGRHSLYGIRWRDDDSIDAAASAPALAQLARLTAGKRFRLVAHEFRESDAAKNKTRAQRRLDALKRQLTNDELGRVTLVAAGSDDPRQIPASEAARELYSAVDLQVER